LVQVEKERAHGMSSPGSGCADPVLRRSTAAAGGMSSPGSGCADPAPKYVYAIVDIANYMGNKKDADSSRHKTEIPASV
jgi:hypothetical protein